MTNNRIIKILILISVMFFALICYITYIQIFQNDFLVSSPYNKRQWDSESGTVRGSIIDCNGVVLAETVDSNRVYPYGKMYSHIIGYNSQLYGRINLERAYNNELLGKNKFSELMGSSGNEIGYNLKLTINHNIQEYAYKLLGNNNGCVIAIRPDNGKIIAMVSKPDFNPNDEQLVKEWSSLVENEDSPFLARATSGLYAPGSTFKLLTALLAIENGYEDMTFDDKGSVKIGTHTFENQKEKAYGEISLEEGFAVSSNVVFCTLGDKLGGEKLLNIAERFGFNKPIDFDFECGLSTFPKKFKNNEEEAAAAIGQGEVLSTPLQMAMVTCGIANKGVIMTPYVVDSIWDNNGNMVKKNSYKALEKSATYMDTVEIVDMMVKTVDEGTAANAAIYGVDVAGKTGTAENEQTILSKNKEHTWFVGFAPAYNPEIVVVVMMEYSGGTGGGNCAPIAGKIMKKYLNK